MSTMNPTRHQIEQFCEIMKQSLLQAVERGSSVEIGCEMKGKDVTTLTCGESVVSCIFIGSKFKAEFTERGYE